MPPLIQSCPAAALATWRENHRGTNRDITTPTVINLRLISLNYLCDIRPNNVDDSTLSKSMTVVASSARLRNARENLPSQETRLISRGANRKSHHGNEGSESDTSISPTNEFSNAPTYRIPVKHSRDLFRPDSSTESNNDQSPIRDRRSNTPRHIGAPEKRPRIRDSNNSRSMDMLQSNNR